MKKTLLIFVVLLASLSALAVGPWNEYVATPPSAGTAAYIATEYVKLANQGNYTACRDFMTTEYEAWLERLGGLEANLEVFANADLQKRFAWRELVEGEKITVWVRVFVTNRNREVNVALNLIRSGDQWKLTI